MKTVLTITSEIFSFFVICVSGYREFTRTTAIVIDDSVSVKPSTLYRRIDVDRNVANRTTSSLDDLFRRKETNRRSRAEIWNWDVWCQLQPKTGSCPKNQQKFYYNAELDLCQTFSYSGCEGNPNRFDTLIDCERHCKGAHFAELMNVEMSCSLQSSTGLCLALYNRYYYDINKRTCKRFIYSGCGGNENRFLTRRKCLKTCGEEDEFYEDK